MDVMESLEIWWELNTPTETRAEALTVESKMLQPLHDKDQHVGPMLSVSAGSVQIAPYGFPTIEIRSMKLFNQYVLANHPIH